MEDWVDASPAGALRAKPITHFYHVYADGAWQKPFEQHWKALKQSGLWDNLHQFYYGVVGSKENRAKVRLTLPGICVSEADTGWEQVTLSKVQQYSRWRKNRAVFYAHTKGAWSDDGLATAWRESMTHDTVMRWKEAYRSLNSHDVAGAFWLKSQEPEHREHEYFFAGNYWWANTEYLRQLPELRYETRYQAEGWIGLSDPKAMVMRHGLSFWGNFAPLTLEVE